MSELVRQERWRTQAARGRRLVAFAIGEATYAFEALGVSLVSAAPKITRVPQGPTHLLGVTVYRGSVVPVVDLARLMDVGVTARPEGWCVAFVTHGGHTVGVVAERMLGVLTVEEDDLWPATDIVLGSARAVRCARIGEDDLATVLDHVQLVEFDRSLERQSGLPRTRAPRGRP